ncbi:TRAP transporter large permease [Amycolatopsis palatopharyngis]|uniref:TRAP transporter large permease n=1 Tax=Amycolatopsis palatopharyngis TaxID=187982 RepID=UPI000E266CC1|nr:TRAP transporter large permease [Amycolatopsis palatopharyngis]
MSYTLIAIFSVLALLGVPLAVSLGIGVAVTLVIFDLPLSLVPQAMYTSMNSFVLVAVPLFILAGNVMSMGGIADRIFAAADSVVGRWRGGLGHVNVVASTIFGGMSGSSVADVGSLGAIEIKAMTDYKYPRPYAASITMVTSVLSSVVPPSIIMIIAAATAGVSVGGALAGGIGPAVLFIAGFMAVNYVLSVRHGYGTVSKKSKREVARCLLVAVPALGAPVIILISIFSGVVTPTEGAGLAVVYSLLVGFVLYREMKGRDVPTILIRSGVTTGTVLFIAMVASIAAYIFTIDGLPVRISDAVLGISENPMVVMLVIGVLLVLIGTVMDVIAAILILVPVLMPTVEQVGIDPLHFVVFLVACLSMGLVTPPVGVALFATSHISRLSIERVASASRWFYVVMIVVLALLAVIPQVTLWPVEFLTGH